MDSSHDYSWFDRSTGFELSGSQTDLQASLESLGSPEKINVSEIDPEAVRHELRALMTQMNQVELERVRQKIEQRGTE